MSTQIKKKRVSKKQKKAWRKHVDIKDVEEFLDDQRQDERLGPPLGIKSNTFFEIDTKPSLELLSIKDRRKLKATKPLKCFSALQPHTKVPDPISKRNRVRSKEERRNQLVKLKELKNRENGIMKAKEIVAHQNRKLDAELRKCKPKRGEFKVDLWANENEEKSNIKHDEWIHENTKKHNLRGTGSFVKGPRKSIIDQKNPLPAVEIPHPGMSYNPSYQDHQNLLTVVAEKEIKLIKEEEHITRCTTGMFQKVTATHRDKSWLIEMSEGLPSKDGRTESNLKEDEGSDDEYKALNPPVQNVKKTLKQRRKHKEQMDLEKTRMTLKKEKKKLTDIHNLKILNKRIETIEKKRNILQKKRERKLELKKKRPKMLSSLKYEDPDLEFHMAQEIAGNLKNLKTEGNLLSDRFNSMQKRNILAPTKRQFYKKAKVKKYTKPGHKDTDWKKTVAR